ncbi:MAG TPA: exodeoxyribonuclease VII small subunit [Methanocorpusculum sp.]|nr:exodeoxyribonuclease VII small subunit [Methanocorpusculum sp.]
MTEEMQTEGTKTERKTELTYEEMMMELKQIAKQLDNPNTSVEEAVVLHKRGMELIQICEEILQKAELTITEVTREPSE